MKFNPLTDAVLDADRLETEYKNSREIGVIRLSDSALFFRSGLKTYYVPYGGITRCFRRVMLVPARMCCGRGNLSVENLVVCGGVRGEDGSDHEAELAQIQLPGDKAARALMEELKARIPHAAFTKPETASE